MADILAFKRPRKQPGKGDTLCRNNHHKWEVWQRKQFEVKSGKLVTVYRCRRCGKQKVTAE